MKKKERIVCRKCTAFVVDGENAYCEEDCFDNEPYSSAVLFEPTMFECVLFEREPE